MGYGNKIFQAACQELERRKRQAEELALTIRGEYLALEKRGATLEELEQLPLGGLRRAVLEGDVETGSVMSGQVAGMLHEIRPVAEIFRELYESGVARTKATAAEWSDAE